MEGCMSTAHRALRSRTPARICAASCPSGLRICACAMYCRTQAAPAVSIGGGGDGAHECENPNPNSRLVLLEEEEGDGWGPPGGAEVVVDARRSPP